MELAERIEYPTLAVAGMLHLRATIDTFPAERRGGQMSSRGYHIRTFGSFFFVGFLMSALLLSGVASILPTAFVDSVNSFSSHPLWGRPVIEIMELIGSIAGGLAIATLVTRRFPARDR